MGSGALGSGNHHRHTKMGLGFGQNIEIGFGLGKGSETSFNSDHLFTCSTLQSKPNHKFDVHETTEDAACRTQQVSVNFGQKRSEPWFETNEEFLKCLSSLFI